MSLDKHTLVVGSSGSGKTVCIMILLKSIIHHMSKGSDKVRAVIYDSKTDFISPILNMGYKEEDLLILNPFDERCVAWDICKDIVTSSQADDVSAILVPKSREEKDPFFICAAQALLSGVIEVFQEKCPDDWGLRDLLLATKTDATLRRVLESSFHTDHLVEYFEPEKTYRNIKTTLDVNLREFRTIAASWHKAKRKFSINDWFQEGKIMVLGNNHRSKRAISNINNLILTETIKHLLDLDGYREDHTFFILDEFRELGKINNMTDLMITGRGKGAAAVLGFQDVFGVDSVYGKEVSREIIGCTNNLGILHINNSQPDTQKWASDVMGEREMVRILKQNSTNDGISTQGEHTTYTKGNVHGTAEQYYIDKLWLPSQFATDLKPPNKEKGMVGLFKLDHGFFTMQYPWEVLFGNKGSLNKVPVADTQKYNNIVAIERTRTVIEPWSIDDHELLKPEKDPKEEHLKRISEMMNDEESEESVKPVNNLDKDDLN